MKIIILQLLGLLLISSTATVLASDPYVSRGFLTFPAEAEIGAVSAVAVDREDRVYVLQRGEPPLLAFDSNGKFVTGWGKGLFKVPHGLCVDAEGNLWATDNSNHTIRKFSKTGELLRTLGQVGMPGNGKENFRSPDDLVFSSRGEMFVADAGNGRIIKLSREGTYLKEWGSKGKGEGQFAAAHGLAIDKEDRIYVADRGNNRVQVFDPEGKLLSVWTGFGNPFGLIVIGNELLVSDGDVHKITHLNREGKITAVWGNPQSLQLPHLLAVNSKGILYVTEVNGKRVQLFERSN